MPLDTKTGHIPTSRIYPLEYRKMFKKFFLMEVSVTDEGHRMWRRILGAILSMGALLYVVGFTVSPSQRAAYADFFVSYILIVVLMLVLILAYEFLYVWTYYYDVGESFVRIRKGVLIRREVSIPYAQIQDVNVDQDVLDHILRLYDVHLSTATERYLLVPHIDGLSYRNAEKILEMIHAEIEEAHQPAAPVSSPPAVTADAPQQKTP